jgi:glyoxylase-like metal-dependent hydrolase (beta-lactamase superfamily II)
MCLTPAPALGLERVAPDVYVQRGAMAAPAPANGGAIGNLGVIVGATGTVVINTGTSRAHAEAFLAAIRRLTDKPVLLAINTQASPDQVLGNGVFVRRGIPVLAHRETDRFMVANCDACIRNLAAEIGGSALHGTELARPTRLIDGSTTLNIAGRSLDLLHFGWTERPGSIAVFDRTSGVLFTGDLASFDRLPEVEHARVGAWVDALERLQGLAPSWIVPGHGPVARSDRLAEVARYLEALRSAVQAAYRRGLNLQDAIEAVPLAEFQAWSLYPTRHRRNAYFTYLAIEDEDWSR